MNEKRQAVIDGLITAAQSEGYSRGQIVDFETIAAQLKDALLQAETIANEARRLSAAGESLSSLEAIAGFARGYLSLMLANAERSVYQENAAGRDALVRAFLDVRKRRRRRAHRIEFCAV